MSPSWIVFHVSFPSQSHVKSLFFSGGWNLYSEDPSCLASHMISNYVLSDLMRFWWVLGLSIHLASIIPQKELAPIPPPKKKKKHTHSPLELFFLTFFHTPPPQKKNTTPNPNKKITTPTPPHPTKKHTQKAAKPQQTNQPFRGFFFPTPLSTWIVTWRGNAAATAYPYHLRPRTQQGLRFWGGAR